MANGKIDASRITLRPFRISDVDDFLAYAGDDRVTGLIRWNTFTSKEEALAFIRDECIPHPWCRSICIDDRSIGFVQIYLGPTDYDRYKVDLTYGVAVEYWGHGIATKAVEMAVPQIFRDLPHLVRLQAFVAAENVASLRVLEKTRFRKEGFLRKYAYFKGRFVDLYIYSLLSSDLATEPSVSVKENV